MSYMKQLLPDIGEEVAQPCEADYEEARAYQIVMEAAEICSMNAELFELFELFIRETYKRA